MYVQPLKPLLPLPPILGQQTASSKSHVVTAESQKPPFLFDKRSRTTPKKTGGFESSIQFNSIDLKSTQLDT